MSDRFRQLLEKADELDKPDLVAAHNGRIDSLKAFTAKPGKVTCEDKDKCQENYDGTVERLWRKYFPGQAAASGEDGDHFRNIAAAFAWYKAEGGEREQTSFYKNVPKNGKSVLRFAVSEMLRKERVKAPSVVDLSARKEDADTRKAVADAEKAEMQAEEMKRQLDARWMPRDRAEEETCVWVGRLRDATAYHLGKNLLAIIHACGGQAARLAEVQSIIDAALAAAANEIANSEEITVEIEDLDEAQEC